MSRKMNKSINDMTVKELKTEIRKTERKLKKRYKAMMTHSDKSIRKSEAYQRYSELFKKTRSDLKARNPLTKMKKKDLQRYLNILQGVENMKNSTVTEYKKERARQRREAREKGASNDLLKFIDKNLDKFEQFVNSKSFADSVSLYEYESDLWDQLRFAKDEEKANIFKLWLEEKEDEFEIKRREDREWIIEHQSEIIKNEGADAYRDKLKSLDADVIHYSEYIEDDNWKDILNRLSKEW